MIASRTAELSWPQGVGLKALPSVDSTNEEARRLAEHGEIGPLWIWAQHQTAGRGRRARAWLSSSEDLTATLLVRPRILRPEASLGEAATLSFVAALALADAIGFVTPKPKITLKWPNDVLTDGAKAAGILLEGRTDPKLGDWVAIGVGLNLVSAPTENEVEAGAWRTAALSQYGAPPAPDDALRILAFFFDQRLQRWRNEGFAGLRTDWLARAARLGDAIEARLPNETISGRFTDVDADGALVLETSRGSRRIAAADIYFP
ncbi:MAG: biotin--[acetyl-CoA-carboxylase] ligase [Pseudomonadota bacterium]